ncbi:MAG: hypothetical protein FJ042_04850 [Candidatus Cloacimonetes bacterium]|nr:hypothetical protein [Candidatus Cloacimonadota bacterium]
MLTIDWKERLNKDADDYLANKLPRNDYDFEIIFIAYPERVNGKIPADIITYVAQILVQKIGKKHEQFIPFYKHLWNKKGEQGRSAFIQIMAKLCAKKPDVYIPIVENAMKDAPVHDVSGIFEKVMFPLLKKHPHNYLGYLYKWIDKPATPHGKAALSILLRLIKKIPELVAPVLDHFIHAWNYQITDQIPAHTAVLKTVAKLDPDRYLHVYQTHGTSREPHIVEILCGAIVDYAPEIEKPIENWTHSGNARVKKAATAALKLLHKKKP